MTIGIMTNNLSINDFIRIAAYMLD